MHANAYTKHKMSTANIYRRERDRESVTIVGVGVLYRDGVR